MQPDFHLLKVAVRVDPGDQKYLRIELSPESPGHFIG